MLQVSPTILSLRTLIGLGLFSERIKIEWKDGGNETVEAGNDKIYKKK